MRPGISCLAFALLTSCASSRSDTSVPPAVHTEVSSAPFEARTLQASIEANVPVLPGGLTSFGAVEHEGVLYVLGGYSGTPHAYSAKDQHGELLAYDAAASASERWSVVSEVPPVQGAALVSHPSGIIRVGGMRAMNQTIAAGQELVSIDVVQRFDAQARRWIDLPALPEGRSSHDAIVIGDTLFVVGGWQLDHEAKGGAWPAEMFTLDLSTEGASWERKATPFARRALAVATVDGKLYVLGGMDAKREISSNVEVYDPQTGEWTRAADFPGAGFGMAAVGANGSLYASGADGVVHRLDPRSGAWQDATSMVLPRFFHRLVASHDGTVWALGGIRSKQSGARVRVAEAVAGERASEPITLRLPSPMPSKNRQGAAVLDDGLYFFGGNNSLGQHDFAPQNFTSDGFRLDLATLEWADVADYPVPRQTMSVATHDGRIYAFGGFGHDGEAARSHPEVFVYSPTQDQWSPAIGSLPAPRGRTQFGLAQAKGKWWILGGLDYDPSREEGDQFRHESAILSAPEDLSEGFSPSGSTLTEPRRAFAGAKYGDAYVVVGGMREGFQLVETCEAFDFGAGSWGPFPCPQAGRLSGSLVPVGDRLAVFAGSSKGEDGNLAPDSSVEVYEPSRRQWRRAGFELPVPAKHLHAFAWHGVALLVSAHNDQGMLEVVLVSDAALN